MFARSTILACVVAVSASSQASFDLMLLQGTAADSNGNVQVHRYDPVNRVNLGSFTIGPRAEAMAVNRARNELYTLDINGGFRVWDYNTGVRKRASYSNVGGVKDAVISNDGSKLLIVNSSGNIYSLDIATGTGATIVSSNSGQSYGSITTSRQGGLYVSDSNTDQIRRFAATGSTFTLAQSEVMPSGFLAGNIRQMAILEPAAGGFYSYLMYTNQSANTHALHYISPPDQFAGFGSGFSLFANGFASSRTIVNSHNGMYFIGADAGDPTQTRIVEYDPLGYYASASTVGGINGGVYKAAIVLAPEPGTMIALGAGLGVLLRRRKKTLS